MEFMKIQGWPWPLLACEKLCHCVMVLDAWVSFYSVVSTIANHNSARKLKSRCSVVSQVWFSSVYLCSDLCLYSEVLCYLVEMIENIAQEDWIPVLKASEDHLKVIKIW